MGYLYVLLTIVFTVYGQLILKWRLSLVGAIPVKLFEKFVFILKLYLDPWVISGFASALVASVFWMAALTKFELSTAYPMMSLSFVFVFILSVLLFNETITTYKILGLSLIVAGIVFVSK